MKKKTIAFLKSMLIVTIILSVLSIQLMTCMTMTGCAGSVNYYKKDLKPKLRIRNYNRRGKFVRLYFWISNPMQWDLTAKVTCTNKLVPEFKYNTFTKISKKSDKMVGITIMGSGNYDCNLLSWGNH